MNTSEKNLEKYMKENKIKADHLLFEESCHSVEEAAKAARASPEDFIKSICCLDSDKNLIIAIVSGNDKVSLEKVTKALNIKERIRIAKPSEILAKTGYPVGGVPPFGYEANFLIDPKVMEKEVVYGGGGSERSLIKISPEEIKKTNQGQVVKIGKN